MLSGVEMIRIGLLEDDDVVAELLGLVFDQHGWSAERFGTLAELQQALPRRRYDLLVLDWSVPDGTAGHLIPWVREHLGWEIPILVESALGDERQIAHALGLGADDYVVKPLRLAEVSARMLALLRRRPTEPACVIACGPYRIDIAGRELTFDAQPVALTRVEFDLASYFFRHLGVLLSRERLLADVWGISAALDTRTVDTHVSRLRKKLRLGPQQGMRISSLHGYGYRLELTRGPATRTDARVDPPAR